MSHNINYKSYPARTSKKAVQAYWDKVAAYEGRYEGATSLPSDIRWIDYVCVNYEEAKSYIESHDKRFYDQLAVKYKVKHKLPNGRMSTRIMWLVKMEYHT